MKTVCNDNICNGCMACVDICPKNAVQIEDSLKTCKAIIHSDKCIDCGLCRKVCPNNNELKFSAPQSWLQGWAESGPLRLSGSSGGVAAELSRSFICGGGLVCSCAFENGKFQFMVADSKEKLDKFSGSKYVKSNPEGIYKTLKSLLFKGKKILFVGLPCQVSALKKFVGESLNENLFTIDLICHGTPSSKTLECFLNQYGISLNNISDIKFRSKRKFQISCNSETIIQPGVCDRYMISFLNGITYTENCYSCKYAKQERISDITLGDSWGSDLQPEEQKKGISLILCQTAKGRQMLDNANLHLEPVDIEKASANNQQLNHPSIKPAARNNFFKELENGKKFNTAVRHALKKQCLRQDIKEVLVKSKILKRK